MIFPAKFGAKMSFLNSS